MLSAIWHEARPYRAAIHHSTCIDHCDLRIDLARCRFDGDCVCRDFLLDMAVECVRYLAEREETLRNPVGAARVHLRTRAPDWFRHRRRETGAQCRSDRIRGSGRARCLPDDFHRALLEYLVDEAGSMGPLDSQDELIRRLAARCAAEFGGAPEDHIVAVVDGIAVIEAHCRAWPRVNVGTPECPEYVTWWEGYVDRPMGRRPRRVSYEVCADAVPWDADCTDDDGQVIAVLLRARRDQPEDPSAAFHAGVREAVRIGVLSEREAAKLIAAPARVAEAVKILSVLT